jgi:hypothetical protein
MLLPQRMRAAQREEASRITKFHGPRVNNMAIAHLLAKR